MKKNIKLYMIKVLTGCEFSGIVRNAFASADFESASCDLLHSESPGKHFQMDIFEAVKLFRPQLLIAFPPCTYLCKAQLFRCLHDNERKEKQIEAVKFVQKILSLDIPYIAIENPIGCLPRYIGNYQQLIYSDWFGDVHRKDICLWLKNLPPLIATKYNVTRKPVRNHVNGRMSQALRSKIKSKFFPSVAEAMANQWGNFIMNDFFSVPG